MQKKFYPLLITILKLCLVDKRIVCELSLDVGCATNAYIFFKKSCLSLIRVLYDKYCLRCVFAYFGKVVY